MVGWTAGEARLDELASPAPSGLIRDAATVADELNGDVVHSNNLMRRGREVPRLASVGLLENCNKQISQKFVTQNDNK